MRMFLLLSMLVLAPLAAAGPAPAVYYLSDGETPWADGALNTTAPEGEQASLRPIGPALAGPSAWFHAGPAQEERIYGPAFVGLWTQANIVVAGNLSASLWLIDGDEQTLIAQKSLDVAIDPSKVPEPTSLIPPDPTDPEAAAFYVAAQLMPLLMNPPKVYEFGLIDVTVPPNATLALGLGLENGELPALGVAMAQYGAATSPSFLYMPWYAPDPPAPTQTQTSAPHSSSPPASSSTTSQSPSPSQAPSPAPESDAPQEDSPGFGIIAVLAALGVVALRRR